MKDKITAILFLITLFTAFVFTGFFSFKNLCGFEEKLLSNSPPDSKCTCLGVINMVSEPKVNKYYCTGLNFSYHNRYLEPLKDNKIVSVYAGRSEVEINDKRYILPSDLQTCSNDDDCLLVKNNCDYTCNDFFSGEDFDLAINKNHHVAWLTRLNCDESTLEKSEEICPLARAVCADQRCVPSEVEISHYYNK